MLAKVQPRLCEPTEPVTEQPVKAGFSDQLRSPPAGSGSVTVTLVAVPAPVLLTVMSKPMVVPALTGPAGFAVFVMLTDAQFTVVVTSADWTRLLLSAVTVALLLTAPQVLPVVCEITWMVIVCPGAMVLKVQVSTCGFAAEIEHPEGVFAGVSDQLSPVLFGRVSVTTALRAMPAVLGLATVITKPTWLPAFTEGASAVLVMVSAGGTTAPDWIWLSRPPIEEPSAPESMMWYGPPLMLPAPFPGPHPRGPKLAETWPPKSSCTAVDAVLATV